MTPSPAGSARPSPRPRRLGKRRRAVLPRPEPLEARQLLTFNPSRAIWAFSPVLLGPALQVGESFRASVAASTSSGLRLALPRKPAAPIGPSAEAFRVPGGPGQTIKATFTLTERSSGYRNEVGLFLVDDARGRIGKLEPGDWGYDRAALARRVVLFGGQRKAGATVEVDLPQGGYFGTYLVPNGTSQQWLRRGLRGCGGQVYFSFLEANADRYPHVLQPRTGVFAFEDLWRGGDRDHNDSVVKVTFPQVTPEQPPVVLIQQPASGLLTNKDVLVVGIATDDRSGVARVESSTDGGAFRGVTYNSQGRFQFPTGLPLDGSADGTHRVDVRATDRSGLTSPTSRVSFTLDTRPPVVSIQAPAPGLLTRANLTVTGTIADALSGPNVLEAQLDSGPFQTVSFNATGGGFSLLTTLALNGTADGPHTVRFRGTDRAGNTSTPVSLSFVLDTTPPPVTLDLDPASDTAPQGDRATTLAAVTLVGQTNPDTPVVLDGLGLSTRSDARGAFAFAGVPLTPGGNPFTARATDAAGNVGTGSTLVTQLATCGFEEGLPGWDVGREGGTTGNEGSVTVHDRRAVLVEGDSFEVTLSRSFTVPANPTTIGFEYDALTFDTADPGFINDAFEVALLGDNGRSIVPTFAADRDAFLNLTEGLPAALGSGVTVAGQRVTLDISQAVPGTTATLVFRLVNNDADETSTVAIVCAGGLSDSVPTPALPFDRAYLPRSILASSALPAGPASTLRDTLEPQGIGGAPAQTPLDDSLLDDEGRVTFTSTEDFLRGTLFNTDATTVQDQLALVPPGEAQTFPFIWISNSGESTVSRLDTRTGKEIGRYRTGGAGGDPSRIAVTGQGDAWVANRGGAGTVVKILLNGFVDRNGNGVVDTCQDLNNDGRITGSEVLPWDANNDGQPDDERIAMVLAIGGGPRGVAIDANDKLWVSSYTGARQFVVFDNETGVQEAVIPTAGYGSYGATIDSNGQLWSVTGPGNGTIVHVDTNSRTFVETVNVPAGAYGITADRDGIIWMSAGSGGAVSRYDPANRELQTYQIAGASFGGGITVDPEGNVWLGSHWTSRLTKVSFESDRKTYKSTDFVQVGSAPKSASVDADGYIWTACLGSNEAYKIDPTTATVVTGWPVPTGASPYNYSDMTGEVRLTVTGRSGSWTEIIDGRTEGVPWIGVGLDAEAPAKTSVTLRVRASDRRETLAQLAWLDTTPSAGLVGIRGRFLEVQARLNSSDPTAEPVVRELSVQSLPAPTVEVITPADGTSIDAGQSIVLSGLATAAQPVLPDGSRARNAITHVLVNGKPVDVLDDSGRFFTRVTIQPGDNAFTIEAGDLYDQVGTTQVVVTGTQRAAGSVDFAELADITASFTADYARTSYAKAERVLNADTAVRNVGQYPVDAPLYVAITSLTDPSVTPLGAAGFTPEGDPYHDVSALVPGGRLAPDGSTGTLAFRFQVPAEARFGYDLRFFGLLNRPPAFTTVPVVEAAVGRAYAYDAEAVDPDHEAVRYALATAPTGLSIDETTGLLSWTPTEADLGSHPVVVRATDPRGGVAEQQFQVRVTTPPPNRPPVFTSTPVVSTTVGASYGYDSDAADPDGDVLSYTLTARPVGMDIHPETGLITWTPTAAHLGQHRITVQASDNRGGVASQSYTVCVAPDPGNHAPVIVSQPVTSVDLDAAYAYDVEAIDPESDTLTYSLTDKPMGMGIDEQTGVIRWTPTSAPTGPVPVTVRVEDGRGGSDEQSFTLTVATAGGTIRGVVWHDLNANTVRDSKIVAGDQPTLLFLLDKSGSMDVTFAGTAVGDVNGDGMTNTRFDAALTGMLALLDGLIARGFGETARVGLVAFAGAGTLLDMDPTVAGVQGATLLGADRDNDGVLDVRQAALRLRTEFTGTNYVSPLQIATNFLDSDSSSVDQRNVIFLSDGEPNQGGSHAAPTQALRQVAANVRAFGIGSNVPLAALQTIDPDALIVTTSDALLNLFGGLNPDTIEYAEPGLAGWTVFLDRDGNVRRDPGEPAALTDANGSYAFTGLAPTTHIVRVEPQSGWIQTAPTTAFGGSHTVLLAAGQVVATRDFGQVEAPAGPNRPPSLSGTPAATAPVGALYRHDAAAFDPDGDPVTFDLPAASAGMTVHPTLGVVVWTPTADQVGTHSVVLRVQDGKGGVALQSFTVTVGAANTAPVVSSIPPGPATAGLPYRYAIAGQDAEGDALAFAFEGSVPAGMTLSAVGVLEWPSAGVVGDYPVVVVATDGRGASSRHAFTLKVAPAGSPNTAPSVTIDARTTAHAGQPYAALVRAVDPDGDLLSYELVSKPNGMTIDAAGLITWTPTADQVGGFDVEVKVSDGRPGGEATADLTLDVADLATNQPPRVSSTPRTAATVNRPYTMQLAAIDPDGDPVTWRLLTAPRGMSVDPRTGALRWTPSPDQRGGNEVVVEVRDALLQAATQRFTIVVTCANQAPGITSRPVTQAWADDLYVYAVRADDPEGDALTFTLLAQPDGMTIHPRTGVIRWTPSQAQAGTTTVLVQVDDGQGNLATQRYDVEVTATPRNRTPVITSRPAASATLGVPYAYAVAATDPEGERLTFSLDRAPDGMTIDRDTGVITWPSPVLSAPDPIVSVIARDPGGAGAVQTYVLAVRVNAAPEIRSSPVAEVSAASLYRYDVRAVDPNGDSLAYRLENTPRGMSIDGQGRITWQTSPLDAGQTASDIRLVVSDPAGLTAVQTFDVRVRPDTQVPVVQLLVSSNLVDPGATVTYQVLASDNVGIASLRLAIDGQEVTLSPGGSYQRLMDRPGVFHAVATVTDHAGNSATASLDVRVFDRSDADFPVVVITSPDPAKADNAVTYLTDVTGTVQDANLDFWRLEYARVDQVDLDDLAAADADWVTLATGRTNVTNARLGTFDPTLLANDQYVVRLFAEDVNGLINTRGVLVSVQGTAKLGNFRLEFTDLSVPLAGIPITVTRVYDTLQAGTEGDFGYGWSLGSQDANIRETAPEGQSFKIGTRVYLTGPDGKRVGFTFDPIRQGTLFGEIWTPRFKADPGVYSTLTVDATQVGAPGTLYAALGGPYNPSAYHLTTRDGLVYDYDQSQGLRKITDRSGNTVTFAADGITHSRGPRIAFERDNHGRITAITDTAGSTLRYRYDAAGNLVAFADQVGNTTRFSYKATPAHYLDTITDPLGRAVARTEYDDQGRLLGIIDASGNRSSQALDPGQFTGTITDGNGHVTELVYDERGNVLSERDPEGGLTRYEYADPANPDRETRITDPRGFATSFTYDTRGNVTSVTDAYGNVTRTTYDAQNHVTSTTDALGHTTTSRYDAAGNLVQVVDASGAARSATYDKAGRMASVSDALGHVTLLDYKLGCPCGSPGKVTNPDGTSRQYQYNRLGQVTRVTDEDGNETSYTYDERGLLRTTTDANGGVITFDYDALGNRTLVRDPVGNETRFVYDANRQLIEETDPLGHKTLYEYDGAGNLKRETDRNGRVTTYTYDRANRLKQEQWLDAEGRLVRTIAYTYDAAGNRLTAIDPESAIVRTYDRLNRIATESNEGTPGVPTVVLTYAYDAAGNVVSVTDNAGVRVESTYDSRNLLARRTWQGGGVDAVRVDFAYDANGQRTLIDRFADLTGTQRSVRTAIDYTDRGLTESMTSTNAVDAVLARYAYEYDRLGLVEVFHDGDQAVTYGYDKTGQLLSADYLDNAVQPDEFYRYDANGNRVESYLHGTGYRTGTGNQLLSDGIFRYEYDDEGNQVRKTEIATGAVTTYAYDHRNRLVHVEERSAGGVIVTDVRYVYDADGRRIEIRGGGKELHIVYNGDNAWEDLDGAGSVSAQYLFGNGIDELFGRMRATEEVTWYLTDNLGSIRALAGASGDVRASLQHNAFGGTTYQSHAIEFDRFTFTGREHDTAVTLNYYRARYYDTATGRFTTRDPLHFTAYDINLYRYVFNQPTNATDPTGRLAFYAYVIRAGYLINIYNVLSTYYDVLTLYDCTNGVDPPVTLAVVATVGILAFPFASLLVSSGVNLVDNVYPGGLDAYCTARRSEKRQHNPGDPYMQPGKPIPWTVPPGTG